jgi:hypothetical protein
METIGRGCGNRRRDGLPRGFPPNSADLRSLDEGRLWGINCPSCRLMRASVVGSRADRPFRPSAVAYAPKADGARCHDLTTCLRPKLTFIPIHLVYGGQGSLPLKTRSFLDYCVPRLRAALADLLAADAAVLTGDLSPS